MERPHRKGTERLRSFPVRGLPLRTDAHGGKVQSGSGTRDGATAGGIIQQVIFSDFKHSQSSHRWCSPDSLLTQNSHPVIQKSNKETSKMNFTNTRLTNLQIFKLRAYFEKLIGRWFGCNGWSSGSG